MSTKTYNAIAILFTALGLIVLIVALSSASWMMACIKYDNLANVTEGLDEAAGDIDSQIFKGSDVCIHVGVMKVAVNMGQIFHMSLGIDIFDMPKTVLFAVIFTCMALLCGLVGIIILIIAIVSESKTSKCTRNGLTMFLISALLTIAGMSAYTHGSLKSIHNPLYFMASMGQSVASIFSNINGGRAKRDITLDSLAIDDDNKQLLSVIFEDMDPMYGYAYFIGWLAAVMFIVGSIFAGLAKWSINHQRYSGPTSTKA